MNKILQNKTILDTPEAAQYIGVAEGTLEVWRSTKKYNLKYIKVGRLVRYRVSDLDEFLNRRTVESKYGL